MRFGLAVRSGVAYAALCLAPSYVADTIRRTAPDLSVLAGNVVDLRRAGARTGWRRSCDGASYAITKPVTRSSERRYRDPSGLNVDLVVGTLKAACDAEPGRIVLNGADRLWRGLPLREWKVQP